MTCQALEAHQKGVQLVGQLHTAMNQVDSSFETGESNDSDNDRLAADSSCICNVAKTNFEQSTDNFFQQVCMWPISRLKQKSERRDMQCCYVQERNSRKTPSTAWYEEEVPFHDTSDSMLLYSVWKIHNYVIPTKCSVM